MRKISQMVGGGARVGLLFLALTLASSWHQAVAATYGGYGTSTDGTNTYYKDDAPLDVNTHTVKGYAELLGGFSMGAGTATFTNVVGDVGGRITLVDGGTLTLTGSLHIAPTRIVGAAGGITVNGGGALVLENDVALPTEATTFTLGSNFVIDGQGHTLTFQSNTVFAKSTYGLTLKNMVIKGLTTAAQFTGTGTLTLQNCIVDLASGTTFTYSVAGSTLTVADTVVIQGGGIFQYQSTAALTINAFSTLYVAPDTTFDYNCSTRGLLTMTAATSTIHVNGGTLKATGAEGLLLMTGRVFLEGKVLLNTNTVAANGIILGDGSDAGNDVNVKIFPGAYVTVAGYLWHKPL